LAARRSARQPKGHGQWHPEIAADVLQRACAFAGIFDPQGRVFGRGAHRGKNGELILHCGDAVFVAGEEREYRQPGMIDGMVYPTAPKIPRPDPDEQGTGPARSCSRSIALGIGRGRSSIRCCSWDGPAAR
jgi:hypothetical protein